MYTGRGKYEIIDGIQRLNAIFTFIEHAFDYKGKYFERQRVCKGKAGCRSWYLQHHQRRTFAHKAGIAPISLTISLR